MRLYAVGPRRLAPIGMDSLPRAVVRSQRVAGARWGARACGGRLGRCATAAAWSTLRLWQPQAQAASVSVRVRLGLPFYLTMAVLTMAGYSRWLYSLWLYLVRLCLLWLSDYIYTHTGQTDYDWASYGRKRCGGAACSLWPCILTARRRLSHTVTVGGGCIGGSGDTKACAVYAVGLRRLAPIGVESLPRAVVRSQRIAGASTVGIAQGGVLQVRLRVASGSVSSGWMGPRLPICTILTMAKKTVSGVWAISSRDSLVA